MELDIQEIKAIIPHRYPFLLVDRITELEEGRRAVGIKNVTANEPYYQRPLPRLPRHARCAHRGSAGASRGRRSAASGGKSRKTRPLRRYRQISFPRTSEARGHTHAGSHLHPTERADWQRARHSPRRRQSSCRRRAHLRTAVKTDRTACASEGAAPAQAVTENLTSNKRNKRK